MFKKRLVALLCGAVVVSGLAVGCGSGDDEKDHPILWNVPETDYLKFYIFQVV